MIANALPKPATQITSYIWWSVLPPFCVQAHQDDLLEDMFYLCISHFGFDFSFVLLFWYTFFFFFLSFRGFIQLEFLSSSIYTNAGR